MKNDFNRCPKKNIQVLVYKYLLECTSPKQHRKCSLSKYSEINTIINRIELDIDKLQYI